MGVWGNRLGSNGEACARHKGAANTHSAKSVHLFIRPLLPPNLAELEGPRRCQVSLGCRGVTVSTLLVWEPSVCVPMGNGATAPFPTDLGKG